METQSDKQKLNNNGQLILVARKDTIRLLEVYVKRSLSLNDGAQESKRAQRKEKWVTMPKKHRRHSSDPSIHLSDGLADRADSEIGTFSGVEPRANLAPALPEEKEKNTKKSKKLKKPSLWKSFLGIFSRKDADEKDDGQESMAEVPQASINEEAFEAVPTCLPTAASPSVPRRKSTKRGNMKKRLSRTLSLLKSNKLEDVNSAQISAIMSVEPTYSYYEKMSEELEKIVHEVKVKEEEKPLTDDEVVNRIIALTKEHGDAIDVKIKDNPTLSNFFQKMSYTSFQRLADAYLENEASPVQNPPTLPPTAPELVKLAFTLDFTARIAGLSRQNICHITSLGNRYLQDRFEYRQACTDHPWSDCDD